MDQELPQEDIGNNGGAHEHRIDDAKSQSAKYLLSLKAKHNISDTAINEIMDTTQDFVSNILGVVEAGVAEKLRENNVQLQIDCKAMFDHEEMFAQLSSSKKRLKYFKDNFGFLVNISLF